VPPSCTWLGPSIFILDDDVWAILTAGGFRVPFPLVILVFDGFSVTGDFLFGGSHLRGGKCLGMSRKGLGKHAVDFVGPAASCWTIS